MSRPPRAGLVTCATTAREASALVDTTAPNDASALVEAYDPHFPTSHDVDAAAMALADVPPWTGPVQPPPATWQPNLPGTPPDARTLRATMIPRGRAREGPHARVVVSPGALALERRDLARAERAAERARAARERDQELAAAAYLATGE